MIQELEERLRSMDDVYYNGAGAMETSDEEYDALRAQYENLVGEQDKTIGAPPVKTKRAIRLPYFMGSLDKIKEGEEVRFERWKIAAGNAKTFIVQPKLDGVSVMYYRPLQQTRACLFTRGDGTMGSDISFLLTNLPHLPELPEGGAIRGEIVMSNATFKEKYSSSFKNNRNLVSGIVNSKTPDPAIVQDLVLVPYEILSHVHGLRAPPSQQMHDLRHELGFTEVISGQAISMEKLTMKMLHQAWENVMHTALYPTDGIVIWRDVAYIPAQNGNPEHAIAFKKMKETATTRIVRVHWTPSKYNVLKPRIEIEPVILSGTCITFVTGFNAKYIMDHGIGKGAMVEVTRSGDVIPHIVAVHHRAEPDMPVMLSYRWNESGVEILGGEDEEGLADIKKINFFFKTMGIKTLAEKTITKLVSGCPKNTATCLMICILKMSEKDMISKAGMGPIESKNLWNKIHKEGALRDIPVSRLMTASGIFGQGFGLRKIEDVVDQISLGVDKMAEVSGWTRETAERFLRKMPEFEAFVQDCQGLLTIASAQSQTKNGTVVFSGFRDQDLEKRLVGEGYSVGERVTSQTRCVLVRKGKYKETVKTKKAQEKGIPVLTVEEFIRGRI